MNIISGNKDIISGCEEDIQSIAKIYLEAFPESVDFFFRRDAGDRILRIIALGFGILLDAGCKFFVAKDSLGNLYGYSIVALDDAELHKAVIRHGHALGAARALFTGKIAIRFTEMLKLGANGMVMAVSSFVLPNRTPLEGVEYFSTSSHTPMSLYICQIGARKPSPQGLSRGHDSLSNNTTSTPARAK
jgi:hypothetical protein